MITLKTWAAAAVLAAVACHAQAALFDRGGGVVYDDVLDITWLQNWNAAAGSIYDDGPVTNDGRMTWHSAKAWADNLVFRGLDDWRLPSAYNADGSGPCRNFCAGSEMGHMFYNNWQATPGNSWSSGANSGYLALFQQVQSAFYWSGTVYDDPTYFWHFSQQFGWQGPGLDDGTYWWAAVAVRDGDVAAVPEPQTLLLWLIGTGAMARRFRSR